MRDTRVYTFEKTYEEEHPVDGGVIASVEVRFLYTVSWGSPEVAPSIKCETGAPYEPPEIEYDAIQKLSEFSDPDGRYSFYNVDDDEYDLFQIWSEGFQDELYAHAQEELLAEREDA
jgi:hypothetical protein